MKNYGLCMVSKEKLMYLVNRLIGFYQYVDDHCVLMEESINHCDRPRKTDMREFSRELFEECLDTFQDIGCKRVALLEDDEESIYESIMTELEATALDEEKNKNSNSVNDDNSNIPNNDLSELVNALSKVFSTDKPITVSADIYINEVEEDESL